MSSSDCLPQGLANNPALRRSSVFHDLMTVFRKNTAPRIFYSSSSFIPNSRNTSITSSKFETDAFLGKSDTRERELDEDGQPLTRQALLERIRQKKEVIGKLRCQAWGMNRKKRTLKLAQKYLEQHESNVSKSHLLMDEFNKRLRLLRRSFSNFKTYLIPWEGKIKRIESHFGSVVSSYFTFLRWIVFVNIIITLLVVAFVVLPETLADAAADNGRLNRTLTRKQLPTNEKLHADEWAVVWHYDGYLRYSPLFYGYYSDDDFVGEKVRYALPLAYFIVTLFIFAYSFFAILRKMAANARMSKLSGSKAEQYIYNWKLFTGWDYTIGNQETASNTVMAVVIKLRESIADSRVAVASKFRCLQFALRVLANIVICAMLAFSIYCISFAVQKSQTAVEQEGNLFTKNQVPSVVATITHVFPMIFDLIGRIENYHPRTALRAHLTRVLVLYVLNYMTFILALFDKMDAIRAKESSSVTTTTEANRRKRQLGDRNPNMPRPPPFASRNFENKTQLREFMERSTTRFSPNRTSPSPRSTPVTIAPQYGPLNINNAHAILRNGSYSRGFESRRLGPAPLPFFTPPPRQYPPKPKQKVTQEYGGPDFPNQRKTTSKVTTTTTQIVMPDATNSIMETSNEGDDIFIDSDEESFNETMSLPQPAERKSTTEENYGSDVCWETIIGQEIVKLVTMDLIVTIVSILLIDFLRGLWIKYCAAWWCWDIETTFPEYGEFKVAENVLHIINNQGMIWLGLFFAPLLPAINNIKLVIIMYIRGWAVMTCNVPAREIFRASRSSNFYLLILLLWLLLCTLPVGFVIASTRPSRACGPFARHDHFYTVVTKEIAKRVDSTILSYMKNVASPGVVIPILLFLMLIIYFLVSLVRGLREANTDLQQQLVHERTEEKKKIFELAGGGKKRADAEREKDRKRRAQHYIPLIEQKRRQTWNPYREIGVEEKASDSSESESEDEGIESPDDNNSSRIPPPIIPSSTAETVQIMQFHPSLASLVENEENEGEEEEVHLRQPLSPIFNYSAQLASKVGYDTPCGSLQSNVVEVATPEEIRSLLNPLMESRSPMPSFRRFPCDIPRDISSPPTVIYASRHQSHRSSYISLYEFAKADNSIPTMISSQRLRENSIEGRAEIHKTNKKTKEEKEVLIPPPEQENNINNTKKMDTSSIQPTFQPWPSIDEVRDRKQQLMNRSPLPLNRPPVASSSSSSVIPYHSISSPLSPSKHSSVEIRPPVPIHRKFEPETSGNKKEESRSRSPSKTFRISVSPTRKVKADNELNKRRFVIKQESMAPSMTSLPVITSSSNPPIGYSELSPRAPRVEFGEDDSPRVLL